jgi:hypothetical protein
MNTRLNALIVEARNHEMPARSTRPSFDAAETAAPSPSRRLLRLARAFAGAARNHQPQGARTGGDERW